MLLREWQSSGWSSHDKFEITHQTNGQVGGLDARFQVLENKLDAKTSSVQSGSGRLLENGGKKGKALKKTKLRFQGIRSKNVRLPGTDAARKRGDVAMECIIAGLSLLKKHFHDYVNIHYNSLPFFFFPLCEIQLIWPCVYFWLCSSSWRHHINITCHHRSL